MCRSKLKIILMKLPHPTQLNTKLGKPYFPMQNHDHKTDRHFFLAPTQPNSTKFSMQFNPLRAPPEVALQCVAGHCYYQLSVSLFLSFSLHLLLLTHFGETPVCENLFSQIFWHN